MKKMKFIFLLAAISIVFSCSDDDDETPVIINEEEEITTLSLTLTPMGGGTTVVLSSQDLDGEDGPNAPVIMVENLAANTSYQGVIEVLNEMESPAEDITEEVAEEDEDHQFFFQLTGGAAVTVTYDDADSDNNPLGIMTTLTTGDAGTGNMVVTLRHLLDKNAAGVAEGDITNAGGDTDIEVTFPITIE